MTTQSACASSRAHVPDYPSDLDDPFAVTGTPRSADRGFGLGHPAYVDHEALAICDSAGRVLRADPATARLLAGSPADLVGCKLADIFVEDWDVVDAGLQRASTPTADPAQYAVEAVGFQGDRVPLLLTMRPLPGSSPTLILLVLEIPMDSSAANSVALRVSRRQAIRATTEFQKELLAHVARGEGLNGMMEILRQHVQRPVVVLDPSRSVLAEAGVRVSDRIALRRSQGALRDTRHGVVTRGSGCLSAAIAPDGRVLGWLCILDEVGDVDEGTCTALEQAISIVTFELMRIERAFEVKAASLRELADRIRSVTPRPTGSRPWPSRSGTTSPVRTACWPSGGRRRVTIRLRSPRARCVRSSSARLS